MGSGSCEEEGHGEWSGTACWVYRRVGGRDVVRTVEIAVVMGALRKGAMAGTSVLGAELACAADGGAQRSEGGRSASVELGPGLGRA